MKVTKGFDVMGDRYRYDFKLCRAADGWAQIDTRQDAPYYGTWINPVSLKIFSYVEGDTTLSECSDEAEFIREARTCFEWHKEKGYFIGVDALETGGAKEAFIRMGLAEYLHGWREGSVHPYGADRSGQPTGSQGRPQGRDGGSGHRHET